MHAHLNYRMLHVPINYINLWGLFYEILHYSKNIVKLRMNMELHGTTVFFTIYRYIIKMLRSQVDDFIFWPFFFLNLICIESQVKDLSTKLFRRVGKKALVLPIGFWKFFSDTNRTTDRLKSKTNQGSRNTKINWMLLWMHRLFYYNINNFKLIWHSDQ